MHSAAHMIRWGMIGVGSVAVHKSGPAFVTARGGRLAGVASRRVEMAAKYAERHRVEHVFESPAALIESDEIDAVYIATPPSSHAELALQVARANKPCCIEKPMSVFYRDAQAIRDAFSAAGVPLFVSYYRRSLPRFLEVARCIREQKIGAIRAVRWELKRKPAAAATADNWRIDTREAPGGLFEDLACHGLDLFDMLFGPILGIDYSLLAATDGASVPDRVEAIWHHADGITGAGEWDFAAGERADSVTITGQAGTIRFSMFENEPIVVEGRDGIFLRQSIDNPVPIQLHHVEAMNAHLLLGAEHPSTGDSAIRTAWATDRILRGAQISPDSLRLAQAF
jgi:1,5-anhydro-D-fructose reductase (1,5-anhydro-D-mannitol-forming)